MQKEHRQEKGKEGDMNERRYFQISIALLMGVVLLIVLNLVLIADVQELTKKVEAEHESLNKSLKAIEDIRKDLEAQEVFSRELVELNIDLGLWIENVDSRLEFLDEQVQTNIEIANENVQVANRNTKVLNELINRYNWHLQYLH